MTVELSKRAVDVGIVVRDSTTALRFYRDTLGLEHVADIPVPGVVAPGTMHRLMCGDTIVKLLRLDDGPGPRNPPGGIAAASGFRYLTIPVTNLEELVADVEAAGYRVTLPPTEVRAGVTIAFVEDP